MDSKQPQLNGAYYGPPIPPQNSYNRVGRRSSCGPCSCLCSLFKFLISIIIILGIIVLVLWFVFRPNEIKVYVTSASLTQFNLTNNNNLLNYDLSLNMAFRNPNKRIGIYYDYIEGRAIYDDSRFGYTQLPTFYQGHKNTTSLFPVFKGQGFVIGDSVKGTYNREKGEGYYYVDVKLYARIRMKVASFVKIHAKPHIDCSLKLPVPGSSNVVFDGTRCDVDFF